MTSPMSAKLLPALLMLPRWPISKRPRTWRETSGALALISGLFNVRGKVANGLISTSTGAISSSAKFELGTAERGAVRLPSFVWGEMERIFCAYDCQSAESSG